LYINNFNVNNLSQIWKLYLPSIVKFTRKKTYMKNIKHTFLIKISTLVLLLVLGIVIKNYQPAHLLSQISKKTIHLPNITKEWVDVVLK
jgi:hypothetical protein